MKNIAIIGAGQLGSRHLQALALHKQELSIYLVDPVQSSLDVSLERFKEVDVFYNKKLYLKKSIEELPSTIEFAIIATNSLQRLSALKDLLQQSTVKYLLLEKFLFPTEEEYTEATKLIDSNGVIAYVNCARRMWSNYRKLQKECENDTNIKLTVRGSNWNLASNAIHFLDLFLFLCNENQVDIDVTSLDENLLKNKRPGYIEISGTLKGYTSNGNSFHLTSSKDGIYQPEMTIESDQRVYRIKETEQKIWKDDKDSEYFKLYHQSQLTHKAYEQLLETNACYLVPFQQAVQEHLMLLKAFNVFLNGREGAIT